MRENAQLERKKEMPGVYEKGGKWFMRLDDKSDGAEVPADIAKVMKLALWAERRTEDFRNTKTENISHDYILEDDMDYVDGINCHLAVFYAIGLLNVREKLRNPQERSSLIFAKDAFQYFESVEDLSRYIKTKIGNKIGLVQVGHYALDNQQGKFRSLHTFIVGVDGLGRVVCFDKMGWKYAFRLVSIETMYSDITGGRPALLPWATGLIDEIKESSLARAVRDQVVKKPKTLI